MAVAPSPSQIQQTVGVLFDGFVLAMIGYGFTFFQTYVYFSQYPGDNQCQKLSVAAIFLLDTASAALISKSYVAWPFLTAHNKPVLPDRVYFYMIGGLPYTEPLTQMNRSLNIHILLSIITMFGVQLYYSFRIWKLGRNIPVASIAILLSTITFSLGLVMVAMILKEPLFVRFASVPLRVRGVLNGLRSRPTGVSLDIQRFDLFFAEIPGPKANFVGVHTPILRTSSSVILFLLDQPVGSIPYAGT
ncbi:hypothetical protein C8R47DRAFT_1224191 [Mycena vitilis]|nr:hypothetical protein C8R47DRAFT_1224191 [Mycena vitilis]